MASNFFKVDKGVTLAPQSSIASPQNGDVYYDSTRNTYVFRNNGASVDLQSRSDVGTASSLTSANFTSTVIQSNLIKLTGSTVSNIHGITASSDAKMIVLYNGSSAVVTIKNASGTEATAGNRILTSTGADVNLNAGEAVQLTYDSTQARWIVVSTPGGSANGGTGKNYLTTYKNNPGNGNFESASTTGWSLGTTGTLTNGLPTGTPTFGSGASGNLSISTVSSGQLAGSYSLSYASSAATTQGNMLASDAFSIDLEDQAKVLTWRFYYKAQTNPGNANWSGTSSNSFGVAVWDVTNSAWLPTTASFGMTQSSGVGIVSGTVQTASNAAQLRLVVYNVNATSGAITLYFDDFSFGPQSVPTGAVITDWQSFTPAWTSSGTQPAIGNGSITGFWRRVGSDAEIQISVLSGTTTTYGTGNYIFSIPTGLVMDNTRLASGRNIGYAHVLIQNSGLNYVGISQYITSTTIGATGPSANGSWSSSVPATPTASTATTNYTLIATVPISGWSSNVQMSNDTDTRIVAASVQSSSDQVISFNTNTKVSLNSVIFDTHGAFDTVNNRYVAPISGKYKFSGSGIFAAVTSYAESRIMFFVNGSQYNFKYNPSKSTNSVALGHGFDFSSELDLKAGDYVELYIWHAREGNGTWTLLGNSSLTKCTVLNVERISGPSVIAATESVNARYSTTAGQSIPTGGTATIIDFGTKSFDSHSAVTTGSSWKFTVPVSGKYRINANIRYNSASFNASLSQPFLQIFKNGVGQGLGLTDQVNVTGTQFLSLLITDTLDLLAGDTVDVRTAHGEAAGRSLQATAGLNYICIDKIGN